jgi:hypothetical protein
MDSSGFNDMRLGLENIMLLAHAMGRTLVMPPKRRYARQKIAAQSFRSPTFMTSLQSMSNKMDSTSLAWKTFLNVRHSTSVVDGSPQYPPENKVKWDNSPLDPLWTYITNVTKSFEWHPNDCLLAFPASGSNEQLLFTMMTDVLTEKDGPSN